jgi:tRNA1Val (adenine37-N6)-methyltransferase
MDPFLLCAFALEGGPARSVIDLGTGSGIMALLLGSLGVPCTGIDIRPEWIQMARMSAAESSLDSVRFEHADARDYAGKAELVVCNPPYFKAGRGKRPRDLLKAHARHELAGTLAEIIAAAARMAPRVCLVLPRTRAREASRLLSGHGRPVTRRLWLEPALVLIEGREGAAEGEERDELVGMRDRHGRHHRRVRELYGRLGVELRGSARPHADR